MLGIGFGRKDRGGRMKRGLGRLSSSAQIDLLDVFATLSKAIGILDRLDNDKQRILVGDALLSASIAAFTSFMTSFTPLGRASLNAAFLMSSFATASLAHRMQSTSSACVQDMATWP